MSLNTVCLRNGAEEAEVAVKVIMISLNGLLRRGIAGVTQFYDLTMICRDPSYRIGEYNLKALQELHLLENDGRPHDTIKNVVLSAVTGDGFQMGLRSPLEDK
ncbi:MAG TPA: hypothetical protein VJ227_04230 [Patescibacteria group bacterium]|nr:hypothetical protein [Patescibacteria group bacterium]